MEILKLLNIDPTMVALQMIPFLVATGGLYLIIFKPMLTMLAERERNIDGFRKEAELLQDEVSSKIDELDQQLAAARAEGQAERSKLRQEALAAEQAMLASARAKSDALLEEARKEINAARDEARSELHGSADQLSQQIASAVLGRDVGGNN